MRLLILASFISLGLCAGEWSLQNPTDQTWCDKLVALEQTYHLISLPSNGCPQIVAVEQQIVSGTNTRYSMIVNKHQCALVVYEQVWTGTVQITSDTCNLKVQHKRQLAGGYHEQDPTDQQYYDKLHDLENKGLLRSTNGVHIVKVATQVVSGTNTKYTLTVHQQQCELIVYEQAWTGTVQITSDTCNLKVQHKRQLTGGYHEQDPTDQQYYDKLHDLENKGLLRSTNGVQIVKVATQVVSGINTKYTLTVHQQQCELIVYEQAWTHTVQITSDTCNLKVQHKRQLVGGWHEQDPTDQQYYDQLHAVLPATNGAKIVKVATQVVNGINTKFTLSMQGRECVLITHQSSTSHVATITSNTCVSVQKKRQILGGVHPVSDMNDEGVQGCIAQTLDKINSMSNSMFRLVDSHIISATAQVVAGIKYTIKLQTQVSSCMNSQEKIGLTSIACPVNVQSQMQPSTWTTTCIYQAWATPKVQVQDVHMAQ